VEVVGVVEMGMMAAEVEAIRAGEQDKIVE
jgi:hypothetical protein